MHRFPPRVLLVGILTAALLVPPATASAAPAAGPARLAVTVSSADEATILTLVNAQRLKACLPVVRSNAAMNTVARNWSKAMAAKNAMSHNPKYSTQIPTGWTWAGENVAAGYTSGTAMMTGWMNSAGHKANILNPRATDIGIGFVRSTGTKYPTWGTQNFAAYAANAKGPFLDVRSWHSSATAITWMSSKGIDKGTACGASGARTFAPDAVVSRAAFATMLYRYAGSPAFTPPKTSPFKDVPTTHAQYKVIAWLYAKGISTGTKQADGTRTYAPGSAVTRQSVAIMLHRQAGSPAVSTTAASPFTDVAKTSTGYAAIVWMSKQGAATGTTYRPASSTTRAALSVFLYGLAH
ncbi:CAP and S-layer homology domain-containing protein [Microbacterium sp. NPDC055903]